MGRTGSEDPVSAGMAGTPLRRQGMRSVSAVQTGSGPSKRDLKPWRWQGAEEHHSGDHRGDKGEDPDGAERQADQGRSRAQADKSPDSAAQDRSAATTNPGMASSFMRRSA